MTKFRKIICTILAMTLLIGLVAAEPVQAGGAEIPRRG